MSDPRTDEHPADATDSQREPETTESTPVDTTTQDSGVRDPIARIRALEEQLARTQRKRSEYKSRLAQIETQDTDERIRTLEEKARKKAAKAAAWKGRAETALKMSAVNAAIAQAGITDPDIAGLVRRDLIETVTATVDLDALSVEGDYLASAQVLAEKLSPPPPDEQPPRVIGAPPTPDPESSSNSDWRARVLSMSALK